MCTAVQVVSFNWSPDKDGLACMAVLDQVRVTPKIAVQNVRVNSNPNTGVVTRYSCVAWTQTVDFHNAMTPFTNTICQLYTTLDCARGDRHKVEEILILTTLFWFKISLFFLPTVLCNTQVGTKE